MTRRYCLRRKAATYVYRATITRDVVWDYPFSYIVEYRSAKSWEIDVRPVEKSARARAYKNTHTFALDFARNVCRAGVRGKIRVSVWIYMRARIHYVALVASILRRIDSVVQYRKCVCLHRRESDCMLVTLQILDMVEEICIYIYKIIYTYVYKETRFFFITLIRKCILLYYCYNYQ